MKDLQFRLYKWYDSYKRDLPWRHTVDPYVLWVSEIIMQQTQVVQGLPYFLRFMEAYPTVQDLASAPEDKVLKLWQGLGYYSRARNLQFAAQQVMNDFNGQFPSSYTDLLTLKGVGDYTASAVSSFSVGESRACVDGNVIRVICRLFGVEIPYDIAEGKKQIKALADEFLSQRDSALHNQSIMEFGALQCVPKNPDCSICPFLNDCFAFANDKVQNLPLKSKKTKVKDLYLYYFVLVYNGTLLIQQRPSTGIWKRLYEFPNMESEVSKSDADLLAFTNDKYAVSEFVDLEISKEYIHLLSHRKIHAKFIVLNLNQDVLAKTGQQFVSLSNFDDYPVSRLIERFWEDYSEE